MKYTRAQIVDGTGFDRDARFEQVKDYNGWTNRETWAVALYVNNDQGWQESIHEVVRYVATSDIDPASMVDRAGAAIRESIEESFDYDTHEGMFTRDAFLAMQDIGSLWRVDWDALGAAFLADVQEMDS